MRLKEQLIALGVSDEIAQKIVDEAIDGKYIPKFRFDEINDELKHQKETIAERDKQLAELKKAAGDNESLAKQIEDLQKANADQKKAHETEIKQLKLDNAIDSALAALQAAGNPGRRSKVFFNFNLPDFFLIFTPPALAFTCIFLNYVLIYR